MGYPKGFGVSAGEEGKRYTGRTRTFSGNTADLTNEFGEVVDQVVTGVTEEIQEEYYCDDPAAFDSPVVNGQTGNEVFTNATVTETAADWAKVSVTRRKLIEAKEA